MISQDLLDILCCPETHQTLTLAEASVLERLNALVAADSLRNRGGQPVREKLDAGLVRSDRQYLYPVRHDIPIMLVDEAVALPALEERRAS